MRPTLSVIIPIYKVEDYLERCVKSVLNQDYRDLEVILVDDGSPDRCPQICDELAKTDERIKVIHKPNGGLSSARNAGIEVASGEYLAFLDSDDQWNQGKLKPLMEQLIKSTAEMLLFASLNLYEDGTILHRDEGDFFNEDFKLLSAQCYYVQLINHGTLHESACTKIFKRNFIIENNLLFKIGLIGEDTEWMFRVLRILQTVAISKIPLFICTENRAGSIQNSVSVKHISDMINTIKSSVEFCSNTCYIHRNQELAHCAYLWSICIGLYNSIPGSQKRTVKKDLISLGHSLPLNSHPKSARVHKVYSIFGLEITSKILGLYIYLMRKNLISKKVKVDEK